MPTLRSTCSVLCILLTSTSPVAASYDANINYRSASNQHPRLALDLPLIQARHAAHAARSLSARANLQVFKDTELKFTHGVASGDPFEDSVILWTRLAPSVESDDSDVTVSGPKADYYSHETDYYVRHSTHKVCAEWVIAEDRHLRRVVNRGKAYTSSDIDFTIKVEAVKLKPYTTYYYQFTQCETTTRSPVGRTKTSPSPNDENADDISFAVYSCANFPNGYFNAYGNAARKDRVDYVLHLGDYIYETSNGVIGRDPRATNPPWELVTLYDYRTRLAQYRTDADLLLSHQKFAWIATWDDHEVADNGWRDGFTHMNNSEASFLEFGLSVDQRKMNAVRAYFEWMPIRQADMDDGLRVWRSFQMGKLLDLVILDTRYYDRSMTNVDWNADYIYDIREDAGRSMMGPHQENWFYHQLINSKRRGAKWRIIGNQVIFSRINATSWIGGTWNNDQWDGYIANRNRTFRTLYDYDIGNNIMLAGDSHVNWVSDLVWLDDQRRHYDPVTGEGSIGVEFAGTAVSSTGLLGRLPETNERSRKIIDDNIELQWNEGYYRGYFELRLSKDQADATFYGIPTVASRVPLELPIANFTVVSGENKLARPVAGGRVMAGALKSRDGKVETDHLTYNTSDGSWSVRTDFDRMFIDYPRSR